MGAGAKKRVKELFTKLLAAEAAVGILALVIVEFFPALLIGIFGAANESVYYTEFAVRAFRVYLCMVVFACVNKAAFIFPSQKRILIILNRSETITQRDLTERLGIQPGSASEILSKLEGSGWIVRTQNEADRRTTDISLTDSGREVAKEALKQRRKRHEEMFSCLSEEEKQELLSLLEKVRCDWKKRYRENEDTFKHGRHEGHGHRDGGGHHDGHGHHGGANGHGGR